MSQQNFRKLTALSFCVALAACGGGGGGSDTPSSQTGTDSGANTESTGTGSTSTPNGGTPTSPSGSGGGTGSTPSTDAGSGTNPPASSGGSTTPPTGGGSTTPPSSGSGGATPPSDGTGGNSGSPTTPPPASPFTAELVSAPPSEGFLDDYAEGTHPNDTVRFVVSGTGLRNVELVSANDVSIKYGTFTISEDGTRATLDWPYKSFPHLSFNLRILAWDVPAGETGESIEVMPARRYTKRPSPGMCAEYQRQTGENACGSVAP